MKLKKDKCYLLIAGQKYEIIWAKIGETKIWESNKQKLLGVKTDKKLSFQIQIQFSKLCKKAGRKLSISARLSSYESKSKKNLNESFHRGAIWPLFISLDVLLNIK